jgi:histidinol dehydrogenase
MSAAAIRILDTEAARPLFARRAARLARAEAVVGPILEAVRRRGDAALLGYARRFDGFAGASVEISSRQAKAAARRLSPEFTRAVRESLRNVRRFAQWQLPRARSCEPQPGLRLSQIVRPLGVIGAYVPGGRHPLPSTVVMTVAPAAVAGVREILVASPRMPDEILGTAVLAGATRWFAMGGAHAIAAFAFGTETVPRADRIVGPGNRYVAAAKKLLAGTTGIDFVAGPTEIVLVAAAGEPSWIAADLLAQAEHDVDASAILLTPSKRLAVRVAAEVARQLGGLPTRAVARQALRSNGAIVVVRSIEQALEIANRLAPEHLSLGDPEFLPQVENAGAVFLGPWSAAALGDYAAGPNHVLPTGGAARLRGGLSAADFVKVIAVQEADRRAVERLRPTVTTLARAEGLEAHARSVEVRLAGGRAGR